MHTREFCRANHIPGIWRRSRFARRDAWQKFYPSEPDGSTSVPWLLAAGGNVSSPRNPHLCSEPYYMHANILTYWHTYTPPSQRPRVCVHRRSVTPVTPSDVSYRCFYATPQIVYCLYYTVDWVLTTRHSNAMVVISATSISHNYSDECECEILLDEYIILIRFRLHIRINFGG